MTYGEAVVNEMMLVMPVLEEIVGACTVVSAGMDVKTAGKPDGSGNS